MKRQPIIKGTTRTPINAALLQEIEAELKRLATMYGVSRSWVIATILADSLQIKKQAKYYELKVVRKRRIS